MAFTGLLPAYPSALGVSEGWFTIQQKVAKCRSAAGWLASRSVGQGLHDGHGLSRHRQRDHPAQSRSEPTTVAGRNLCQKWPKSASSLEFGRTQARDVATRRAEARQMTAARSILKLRRPQVIYHALIGLAIIS
jgi:hypothetical protein